MARSDYYDRAILNLQTQRQAAEAVLGYVGEQQNVLLESSLDSVARNARDEELAHERALAEAELNRIEEDLRRLEIEMQDHELKEFLQEKDAQLKEQFEKEDMQKAEAADKERQAKEELEKQEQQKQENLDKEQALKAEGDEQEQEKQEALKKEELLKAELEKQEAFQKEELLKAEAEKQQRELEEQSGRDERLQENPISEIVSELAFAGAQVVDTFLEIKQSIEFELEKRALEDRYKAEQEVLKQDQEKYREEMKESLIKRGWEDQKIKEVLERQAQEFARQQQKLQEDLERERRELLERQAREAQERSDRAARDGLSL